MNGKKVKRIIVAAALIAVLAIGGISAYFTDGDTATNTFTVGSVQIDLQEPSWEPANVTKITPEQEIAKDPQVKNIGVNDAFVFLEVVVPYAKVVTAQEDGTKNTAADTELFSYTKNAGWVEVGDAAKDTGAKTFKHIYAYVGDGTNMKALAKDAITPTLFDNIKFANIVEDQAQTGGATLENQNLNVVVNAYAIQTNNINDAGGTAKTAPTDVWAVLSTQNPSTEKLGVTENSKTDVIEP